jgi:exodeoxyribonuclease-3
MITATWNVNSVRMRLERLLHWLERRKPDIVCLQETKATDADFPSGPLNEIGYECCINGQKSYNGVAILSRFPITEIVKTLPGDDEDTQRRFLACTVKGINLVNVYVPNGSEVGCEKYDFKLEWYRRLRRFLEASYSAGSEVLVCGDMNVAPEDRDVWDPDKWRSEIMFSDPEKAVFRDLLNWGLCDALRIHHQEGGFYTWWDYRNAAFHRGWGLRIDHVLLSAPLARRCVRIEIDKDERKGEKPSDHAPVLVYFD